MFKKCLLLGISAGLLAALGCIIYARVYSMAMGGVDFSKVANPVMIVASCLFGTVLAAIGFYFMDRWLKAKGELLFNFVFVILSFATVVSPFAATLPLDVEFPELFPGFAVPMHFFPALAWFTLKPLFIKNV